ncbi:MAG: thioredoxin family protein [Undibacterium sp.]|nr:thioredoxin family protein [Opitutaceae bacterium]
MPRLLPLLVALCAFTSAAFSAPEYPQIGPDLYDPKSDGEAQITAALATAKAEHKNVLLMFGANWCVWCHRLHRTFRTEAALATALKENYVLVLIDSNWRHGSKRNHEINLRYGNPLKEGLPVLVVIDPAGQQLTTQETGALEDGKSAHDPAKVAAFLARWGPKKP